MLYNFCTNMKQKELFQRMGLDEKQSVIYLALLGNGTMSISDIARRTGFHRPTIYQTLAGMLNSGLVEQTMSGKQRRYRAAPPEHLEAMLEETREAFHGALPELHTLARAASDRMVVRTLSGKSGLRAVFEDLLRKSKSGDIFYRYSSPKDLARADRYLPANYRTERDRKHLERFVITGAATAKQKRPRLERALRIVPPEIDPFAYDATQLIYRDTVAFVDYSTETAIIIESPTIAALQRSIFKLLYDRLE